MTKSRWTHGDRPPSVDWHDSQRIALITGANQGIGYALVEELAPMESAGPGPAHGRNPSRVSEAAAVPRGSHERRPRRGRAARRHRRRRDRTPGGRGRRAARRDRRRGVQRHRQESPRPAPAGAGRRVHRRGERRYARDPAFLRPGGPSGRALDHRGQSLGTLGNLDGTPAPLFETPPSTRRVAGGVLSIWLSPGRSIRLPDRTNVPSGGRSIAAIRSRLAARAQGAGPIC